jgi:hypothetical protein
MSKSTKPWGKLSETLPGFTPGQCQLCGHKLPLIYWQECDEDDQPTRVFVPLCQECSDRLIEPHPRLYRETSPNTPMPGAMPICLGCIHSNNLQCQSPVAKFNGGPGLEYEPKGQMVHLCRSPRRLSGWHYMAEGPVTKCSGKETEST